MSMDIAEAAMCLSVHVGIGNWYQKMGISIDYAIIVIVHALTNWSDYQVIFLCSCARSTKDTKIKP